MHINILTVAIIQSSKINKSSKFIFIFADFYIHTGIGMNLFIRNILLFGHSLIVD